MSNVRPTSTPKKPACDTPMTSKGWPSSTMARPTIDGSAAVLLLPEPVAEDDAGSRARFSIVGRRQQAADVRRHAERLKEIAADPDSLCGSRLAAAGQVERHGAPGEHLGEGLLPLAHGAHNGFVMIGRRLMKRPVRPFPFVSMLISTSCCGILDRKRPEAHRVDELEDGRVRADAERERQDGDDRESGIEPQEARAVAQVLPDGLERARSCSSGRSPRGSGWDSRAFDAPPPARVSRHSARHLLVDLRREIRLELAPALVVPIPPTKEASPAHSRFSVYSAGRRMRLMARTISSQRLVCSASCVGPRASAGSSARAGCSRTCPRTTRSTRDPRVGGGRDRASRARPAGRPRTDARWRGRWYGRAPDRERASGARAGRACPGAAPPASAGSRASACVTPEDNLPEWVV